MGDVEDFIDIRVDAASPGPRVTFNIQDTVNYIHSLRPICYSFTVSKVALNIFNNGSGSYNILSPSISICLCNFCLYGKNDPMNRDMRPCHPKVELRLFLLGYFFIETYF